MKNRRPLHNRTVRILITNDDGIAAPGLRTLVDVARGFGEVKVFAPDRERSACAHGMTMREPLRVVEASGLGVQAWAVSGLPADCVNMGRELGWPDGCDLVLSGINAGPNLGFDTTYSGTVAGAMEGCAYDMPSIAVSLASLTPEVPLDWASCGEWLMAHLPALAAVRLPRRTFLNVNVPALPAAQINGIRVAPLAERIYEERIERRDDPWGNAYFWQGGAVPMGHPQPGTDVDAVRSGWVAVTPVSLDWTAHGELQRLASSLGAVPPTLLDAAAELQPGPGGPPPQR